ncbi:MAG: peptidoglycan editing factor PgeF [Hyphomonadaceae bacterium]|nr:peptidoglycan editing factor PgeF [Hyphomonadaceae bacterium]
MQRDTPILPHAKAHVLAGVKHGFFGREGGISTGIYATLNAGTGSGDDPANVLENRARIAAAFEVDRDHLCGVHQVHSPTAVFIDGPWQGERPRADALVTKTQKLAISILTADCAPILFADVEAGVIGAAHAGWRGALGGVIEATVALMVEHGAARSRIAAAIGPCIHQPSYEVGPEFEAEFRAGDSEFGSFFTAGAGDRFHFDLPGFCASRLKAAGIGRVETMPLDTYAESTRLHSHRRSVHEKAGDYGRNCSVIMLA